MSPTASMMSSMGSQKYLNVDALQTKLRLLPDVTRNKDSYVLSPTQIRFTEDQPKQQNEVVKELMLSNANFDRLAEGKRTMRLPSKKDPKMYSPAIERLRYDHLADLTKTYSPKVKIVDPRRNNYPGRSVDNTPTLSKLGNTYLVRSGSLSDDDTETRFDRDLYNSTINDLPNIVPAM